MLITTRFFPDRAIGSSRAHTVLERNVIVYRRNWTIIVTGFFEPIFYLLGIGFGTFDLTVEDALGNVSNLITDGAQLEVYDAATPTPADPPTAFTAEARAGGMVALQWMAVDLAQTYQLYRDAGDCAVAPNAGIACTRWSVFPG